MSFGPLSCFRTVLSIYGLGLPLGGIMLWLIVTQKGFVWLSGCKFKRDERGFETVEDEGTHGTSGWMDESEMQKVFELGSLHKLDTTLLGKLTDGMYVGMQEPSLNRHVMVYGASGTGKSRGFVKPFLLQAIRRGESMVLTDPKGEFFESFAQYARNAGYTVRAFNLLDAAHSDAWNVMESVWRDESMVQAVAETIINNTSNDAEKYNYWQNSELNLLIAMIHYYRTLTDSGGNLRPIWERSLGEIRRTLAQVPLKELSAMFAQYGGSSPAKESYDLFRRAGNNCENVITGLGTRLHVFQDRAIDKITSYNEIDLEKPGFERCLYFCIISDSDDSMNFLSSLFITTLLTTLTNAARRRGNERGALPVPVNFILDEFCNIGRLGNDFKRSVSTARSRNIHYQMITQGVAQLSDRYPGTEWEELVGNCDTQLMLGCNDNKTAKYISEQCGAITIRTTTAISPTTTILHTASPSQYRHSSANTQRLLLYPDEVRRLDNRELLVMVRGHRPVKLQKIIPEEHPDFPKLIYSRIGDYRPAWRMRETSNSTPKPPQGAAYEIIPPTGTLEAEDVTPDAPAQAYRQIKL